MKTFSHLSILFSLLLWGTSMSIQAQPSIDRTVRPQPQPVPRLDLPDIQKTTLKNGLKVWLVEQRELPVVALNLVIQSGSAMDPANKPGVASMTADVLDEGTATRDALEIADALEFVGADLAVRSSFDGTFVSLSCLTKHLPVALEIYADVLVNPTFPQKEFDRLKEQRLTSLLQQKDRPPTIASLAFNKILYGNAHPYGNDPSGDDVSVRSQTREDLVEFYTTHYRPNNATLIVVGDISLKEITRTLEKAFASWKAAPVPAITFPSPVPPDARRVYLIDKPAAAQSEVRIGFPAAARNTPDFFPLVVLNRILGGQFASRLNMNLRERHGYSYGVRSAFAFNKQPGPFVASGGVVTAKTDSSLIEFMYEIDLMFSSGATPEELDFVKKGLAGSFALTFETASQIASAMQNLVLYSLPDDYYETYLQKIDGVTLEEVQQVAKKYLNSSTMAVVVVGDLSVIKEGVEKLKLGETVMCDVSGNKLP